jgi:hypothetical protein
MVKVLTILIIAFSLLICSFSSSYAQDEITEKDIEELIDFLLNLDKQSLELISQLLNIDFAKINKEELIIDVTRFIRDNVNVISNSNDESEYVSITLNFGKEVLKAEVGYYFKKKVKTKSIEYSCIYFSTQKVNIMKLFTSIFGNITMKIMIKVLNYLI